MQTYFKTLNLNVGYNYKTVIEDINLNVNKGEILTIIGPNGVGKSTILKSITKHLKKISGTVYLDSTDMKNISAKKLAKQMSIVFTGMINPELMTCYEVVAMGRYPYTNSLGNLSQKDKDIVNEAVDIVNARDYIDKKFNDISDGQKQRIMLARAICQKPKIMILDEPTSFLDIRYKVDFLNVLQEMSKKEKMTIIMSLHEIDLACKISDKIACVKGNSIVRFGSVDEVIDDAFIKELYDIRAGEYNSLYGSVELRKPQGEKTVFVIGGNGKGVNCYRFLQKKDIPFISGILFENDIDYMIAKALANEVIYAKAFSRISDNIFDEAVKKVKEAEVIIDCGCEHGEFDYENVKLIELAKNLNKYKTFEEFRQLLSVEKI